MIDAAMVGFAAQTFGPAALYPPYGRADAVYMLALSIRHASIATTARYLDHIAPYAAVEAIGRRAW